MRKTWIAITALGAACGLLAAPAQAERFAPVRYVVVVETPEQIRANDEVFDKGPCLTRWGCPAVPTHSDGNPNPHWFWRAGNFGLGLWGAGEFMYWDGEKVSHIYIQGYADPPPNVSGDNPPPEPPRAMLRQHPPRRMAPVTMRDQCHPNNPNRPARCPALEAPAGGGSQPPGT